MVLYLCYMDKSKGALCPAPCLAIALPCNSPSAAIGMSLPNMEVPFGHHVFDGILLSLSMNLSNCFLEAPEPAAITTFIENQCGVIIMEVD